MKTNVDFSVLKDGNIYKYYAGGQWKESRSGNLIEINNPYGGSLVGKIQACTKDEVDDVIATASMNVKCWEETLLRDRANVLQRAAAIIREHAEMLGQILMQENAKPLKSATSEINRTADIFDATAEAGIQMSGGESYLGDATPGYTRKKISMTYRVPLGVVLCIGPFNYPFNLTGSKIAPALMAGNSIVMKAPTEGSITASYYGVILEAAGVPPGVFNFVTGRGSEIGDHLVSHADIDMVAFTGSSSTGEHIAKTAGLKTLLLELGGKDAAIILEDADIKETIENVVAGAFKYSGQRCTAVKRVLPMPVIADKIVDGVVEKVKKLTVGNPADNVNIGPVISNKQADYIQELIDDALEKGAVLRCGNRRENNLMWPTVLDHVTPDMRVAWEEPFGPVLPVIRIESIKQAIEISNTSQYGLQGMIFTENIDLAFNIAQELEVGTVQINGQSSRGPDHFPFLGAKSSGLGTQGIKYSIQSMSRPKVIALNLTEKGKLIHPCKHPENALRP